MNWLAKTLVLLGAVALGASRVGAETVLSAHDRVLVLAPHPDDEVLGAAGIIQRAVAMRLPVRVVFLTYGDSYEWAFWRYRRHPVLEPSAVRQMGLVRHDEALAADRLLGLGPERLSFLGYPDFGTNAIWTSHWGGEPPHQSMLTKVTQVPYSNAYRPGAPYKGEDVLSDLTAILRDFKPTKIFVSHPADWHPDHRALAMFTQVALWETHKDVRAEIFSYLIHYKGWPVPAGDHPDRSLEPPVSFHDAVQWRQEPLTPDMVGVKMAALQAHKSQYGYDAGFLSSFVRRNELFGNFPPVPLYPGEKAKEITAPQRAKTLTPPPHLTEEQKMAFVGVEKKTVIFEGDRLTFTIRYSKRLGEKTKLTLYVFGYRADRPFAQMPKITVHMGPVTHEVLDQQKRLPDHAAIITRQPGEVVIQIPLEALGHPDRVLTSSRSSLAEVPLDWTTWRVLELKRP